MKKVTWKDVEIANKRIDECKERRSLFAKKYEETNEVLYKRLAESETESIKEINDAICEAVVYLTSNEITK